MDDGLIDCLPTVSFCKNVDHCRRSGQVVLVLLLDIFGSPNHVFLCPAEDSRAGGQDWLAKETNKGNRGKGKCSLMGGRRSVNCNMTIFARENLRESISVVRM